MTTVARLIDRVIDTPAHLGAAIARIALALADFPHGAQHALGWFGGYGFHGHAHVDDEDLGLPGSYWRRSPSRRSCSRRSRCCWASVGASPRSGSWGSCGRHQHARLRTGSS